MIDLCDVNVDNASGLLIMPIIMNDAHSLSYYVQYGHAALVPDQAWGSKDVSQGCVVRPRRIKDSALNLLGNRPETNQMITFVLLSTAGVCGDPPSSFSTFRYARPPSSFSGRFESRSKFYPAMLR